MEKLGTETKNVFQMEYKRLLNLGILLFVLQLIGIGIWFFVIQPEKRHLLNTLGIALFLVGLNLLVGLAFFLLKKNDTSKLFYGNSVLGPLIFFAWWIIWFLYYAQ